MRAAVYEGAGKLRLKDVPVPAIEGRHVPRKYGAGTIEIRKEEQVLLKVEGGSICGSDLHILEGSHGSSPPVILGHEYVARVVQVGEAIRHLKEGQRVAVDPNIKCGLCLFCRSGRSNLCQDLTTLGIFLDGGLAEYNVAPAKQLFPLPEAVSVERAVLFEPLSCVVHALEKVRPQVADSVLIFGGGPIGCCFVILCKASGASWIAVVEPSPQRKSFAKMVGASAVIAPGEEPELVAAETPDGVDVVIDASGRPEIVATAIDVVRPGGSIVLFGQQSQGAVTTIDPTKANQKEVHIVGSFAAANTFCQTIDLLGNPSLPLEKIVSHRLSLDEVHVGFELMAKGECLKVLITP